MTFETSRMDRRQALRCLLTAGAVVTCSANARRARPTAAEIMGPFYPIMRPLDEDSDLTAVRGIPGTARGRRLDILGQVIDPHGTPIQGAQVELWQANHFGRYAHASDRNIAAPLDPCFQGFGRQMTDPEGRFRFLTVFPGAYPVDDDGDQWLRTPHIHFDIRGTHDRLVTQVYFEGERRNDTDRLYLALSPADRETVTLRPRAEADPTGLVARWQVVLATG